jgi:histidyl-tRNA synthetase
VLESTELFVRSVGESSDIVNKEMFSFEDRGGRRLTLRPENTAGVVRAYVEHSLAQEGLVQKLYYMGPQFRAERPQKGRFREFRQIGAEVLGAADPATDAEILIFLFDLFSRLGFTGLRVSLNSVGTDECRPAYVDALRAFLAPVVDSMGEDDRRRLEREPVARPDRRTRPRGETRRCAPDAGVLDDESLITGRRRAARRARFCTPSSAPRRLDYYRAGSVTARTSSPNALLGGGRYDRLVSDLGGRRLWHRLPSGRTGS